MPSRLLRRAIVALALLVLVALAAALAFSLYAQRRLAGATERFEAVLGPIDLKRFVLPEVAERENAATWLVAGAAAVVLSEEERELLGRLGRAGADWDPEDSERIGRILEANAPALELLGRAVGCAASTYSIDYEQGAQAELPEMMELIRAGRLVLVDGRLALAAADGPRFRRDLAILDRLAGSLADESLLIALLIAQAADRFYLDLVHGAVTGGTKDRALLDEVEAALDGRDRRGSFRRALGAEGSMMATASLSELMAVQGGNPLAQLRLLLGRPVARLLHASLLDEYSAIGRLTGMSVPEIRGLSEVRFREGFPRGFAITLYPNLIDAISKLKAVESVEQLAMLAVRARRAGLAGDAYAAPSESPILDPYTGGPLVATLEADGSLVLEAPEALELWLEAHPQAAASRPPHFRWRLPPP